MKITTVGDLSIGQWGLWSVNPKGGHLSVWVERIDPTEYGTPLPGTVMVRVVGQEYIGELPSDTPVGAH